MMPNDYQKAQARTESDEQTRKDKMANYSLGLVGESVELFKLVRWGDENVEMDILKEAGDIHWYVSGMARVFGWEMQELVDAIKMENMITKTKFASYETKDFAEDLVESAGDLADLIKKIVFHGHPEDKKVAANVFNRLSKVVFLTGRIAYDAGWTVGEVLEHNIEKLKKRFPNGFSTVDSINRVDAE